MEIRNQVAALRQKRGLSAAGLAEAAGVTRQTIYAIEAGSFVPNTVVALRLAQALQVSVEDLFALPAAAAEPELPSENAVLLSGSDVPQPGQAVQLCQVEKVLIATAPSPVQWFFPASDAIVGSKPARGRRTRVNLSRPDEDFRNRILIAGCDPGLSVLARHVQPSGAHLVLAHRNSSQALRLLKEGSVHVAGTHLRDERSGESNIPEITRMFAKDAVAVVSFAVWEQGILTAKGNPKAIRGIEDLNRADVCMVNRETGAGSRILLDVRLRRLKMDAKTVNGYQHLAAGHLAAAWMVRTGAADCCIATRAAARASGLDFTSLVTERYDLVLRRDHLNLPAVQALMNTLNRSGFRRELEGIGGYDTATSGSRML